MSDPVPLVYVVRVRVFCKTRVKRLPGGEHAVLAARNLEKTSCIG
jgi:hypothetical protein